MSTIGPGPGQTHTGQTHTGRSDTGRHRPGQPRPGVANALIDVTGLRVGHHTMVGQGALTGCTVVLAPDGGMVAGVDVRGGGPGTRETDLLSPLASIERIHAIVLTGGSAYGLAVADGAMLALAERNIGLPVGRQPHQVVPIVPAAVLFDLGRGGDFGARPTAESGRLAALDAFAADPAAMAVCGSVGAGTGAVCGGLKGGIGGASAVLPDGSTVAALVVVNAAGSAVDSNDGVLLAARNLLPGDGAIPRPPTAAEQAALAEAALHRPEPLGESVGTSDTIRNTTIGVLATDATLTKAQCTKLAGTAHDGLARALNPVHTLFDGDTLFAASTATRPAPDLLGYQEILCVAADVVSRAVVRALLAADSVQTMAGGWPSYRELAPSAFAPPQSASWPPSASNVDPSVSDARGQGQLGRPGEPS